MNRSAILASMLPKTITSLQHPIVKYFVELRKSRSAREEHREVLLAGEKLVRELSLKQPLSILMTLDEAKDIRAEQKYIVSPEILKKVTGLSQPDGYAASIALPEEQALEDKERILILDRISDPGNLGTLFRTALALGWEGIWLLDGCVDPFNDKALRAARGATFWLPFAWTTFEAICLWAKRKKASLYTADLQGETVDKVSRSLPIALILSNESDGARKWPSQKITIPMKAHVESLNVAASGAILLFALRKSP
ncbi:MAG: RNA methyltransferase [Chlamydiae bacterium]|nr:RNA methyltransferase [Chlamydiota bacterium]